jgi:hypothetical protein
MKNKFFKLVKGFCLVILLAVTIVFAIYTAAWFAFTKRAEAYMNLVWANKEFTITGERPSFTGFPLPPEARFSGSFAQKKGFTLITPDLYYSGFPVIGQLQYIEPVQGLKISSIYLDQDIQLDYAAMQIRIPLSFPSDMKRESVSAWQETNAPFTIPKIVLKAGEISAIGSGTVSLDENLQIKADIDARVIGMEKLLDDMEEKNGKRNIAIARNMLNMLIKTDELTGQTYFETTIKIQNRGLYFGPLRITGLPEIKWE